MLQRTVLTIAFLSAIGVCTAQTINNDRSNPVMTCNRRPYIELLEHLANYYHINLKLANDRNQYSAAVTVDSIPLVNISQAFKWIAKKIGATYISEHSSNIYYFWPLRKQITK